MEEVSSETQAVIVEEHIEEHVEEQSIALVEALIFAAGAPVNSEDLARISNLSAAEVEAGVTALKARYEGSAFGFELVAIAGGYQFRTKSPYANYVRELKADKPKRLTTAALETLAVIAYRQPVVRSDIEKIRGVDVSPTIKTLLERNLIRIVGHQSSVGQPALFGTTDEFLKVFGLNSLGELPTLRDLNEIEREPGEERTAAPVEEGVVEESVSGEESSGEEVSVEESSVEASAAHEIEVEVASSETVATEIVAADPVEEAPVEVEVSEAVGS